MTAMSGEQLRKLVLQMSRFGLVGIANTALGFAIIAGLDVGLGVNRQIANAAGYAAGMILSYVLNNRFVFTEQKARRNTGPRFVLVVALSFAVNQAILALAGHLLGEGVGQHLAAQLIAMVSYTTLSFVLFKLWVFR